MVTTRDNMKTVSQPFLWSNQLGIPERPYWRGVVFTKQGIVAFYQQTDPDFTTLYFVWQGKQHTRRIDAFYSNRYTVTLARRFAEEIAGGQG